MTPEARDLSDERTLRLGLEKRLADEVDKARVWRERAEERSGRIRLLEQRLADLDRTPPVLRWAKVLLAPNRHTPSPALELPPAPAHRPSLATVSVASVVGHPGLVPVVAEATGADPIDDSRVLAGADLLLVDGPGWRALTDERRRALTRMLETPGRPPFVFWNDGSTLPDIAERATMVVTLVPDAAGSLLLPGSYSPSPPTFPGPVVDPSLETPHPDVIAAAASGATLGGPPDPAAAHRALRWAFRHHRPSRRLHELLAMAGVPHPDPSPTVVAVLVSNRPDLVAQALARLGSQTWRPLEVVVGLHGIADPGLSPPASDIDMRVVSYPTDVSLGECLNRAIDASTADVIAKIDDDDHYGPAYLEDALRDLDASGCPIVGKASVYAYLAGEDVTVVRRPGIEHKVIDGTLGGNTMVFERGLWERLPFPHRPRFVDTIFMKAARRLGHTIYSGSRFEFCAIRHGSGHTFAGSDDLMGAGAEAAWRGLAPDRAFVPDAEATA